MEEHVKRCYRRWLYLLSISEDKDSFVYACGRIECITDLLRLIYGSTSDTYIHIKEEVETVEVEVAKRLEIF